MTTLSPEAPDTRDELIKSDFIVPGSEEGTFRYPFKVERAGLQDFPDLGSPYKFELSSQTSESVFVAPGFDMQEVVSAGKGAIVEVAGPTTGGYQTLEDIDLPRKPIITNIASGVQPAHRGLSALDKLTLDTLASAQALPFKDESVSLLTTSCLTRVDLDRYSHYNLSDDDQLEMFNSEIKGLYSSAIKKVQHGSEAAALSQDEIEASPRIGLWHEAARVLEPDGLFVMRGAGKDDLKLGEALGFEVVAHTSLWGDSDDVSDHPYEYVFRRKSIETEESRHTAKVRRGFGHLAMQKLGLRK